MVVERRTGEYGQAMAEQAGLSIGAIGEKQAALSKQHVAAAEADRALAEALASAHAATLEGVRRLDAIAAEFGPGSRVSFLLYPPLLRALGLRTKLRLGPWFRPALYVLRAMKGLRHTPFDPFGRTRIRRLERQLVAEYRSAVEVLLANLSPDNLDECVRIAGMPDEVRGYEDIKLARAARYREQLAAALAELKTAPVSVRGTVASDVNGERR